jgi:hypothetical protein
VTSGSRRRRSVTAAELMAQLAQDKEFQEGASAREAELQSRVQALRTSEQPIVQDLRRVGVEVTSVWDLVNSPQPYPAALPVLLEHLERGGYPDRVMASLGRALAVKPAVAIWNRLHELYLRSTGPEEEDALAAALAAAASRPQVEELVALLGERSRGASRIHFLTPILRLGGERGQELVASLRADPVFGREATALLRGREPHA